MVPRDCSARLTRRRSGRYRLTYLIKWQLSGRGCFWLFNRSDDYINESKILSDHFPPGYSGSREMQLLRFFGLLSGSSSSGLFALLSALLLTLFFYCDDRFCNRFQEDGKDEQCWNRMDTYDTLLFYYLWSCTKLNDCFFHRFIIVRARFSTRKISEKIEIEERVFIYNIQVESLIRIINVDSSG